MSYLYKWVVSMIKGYMLLQWAQPGIRHMRGLAVWSGQSLLWSKHVHLAMWKDPPSYHPVTLWSFEDCDMFWRNQNKIRYINKWELCGQQIFFNETQCLWWIMPQVSNNLIIYSNGDLFIKQEESLVLLSFFCHTCFFVIESMLWHHRWFK